jgi:hypothetical protein
MGTLSNILLHRGYNHRVWEKGWTVPAPLNLSFQVNQKFLSFGIFLATVLLGEMVTVEGSSL